MSAMFLTDEDLQALTGLVMPSAQRRWLAARGYPFELNATGRPRVLRSVVEDRLGTKVKAANDGFNLAAAKKAG